jgi:hypothetical protein
VLARLLKETGLDRFSQGIPDPQEGRVLGTCEACGGEIYEGEEVFVINGNIIHADWECLQEYIGPAIMSIEDALGVA